MINNLYDYPQLKADGTSSDFPNTIYENEAVTSYNSARVSNELHGEGSETLLEMIKAKKAAWMIEVRSPAALYSKTHISFQRETFIRWDSSETGDKFTVFIISQLVALEDVDIPAEVLHQLWHTRPSVRAPDGAVLAWGHVLNAEPLTASILNFRPDETLRDGVITVFEPDEHIRFTVKTALDLYRGIATRRDIHLGALIAAMGKLNREDHDPSESRVLRSISQRLEERGVPDWMSEEYDPALAATTLEPFLTESEETE